MNTINYTNAFHTMTALLTAYRRGDSQIDSLEFPFLTTVFAPSRVRRCDNKFAYFGLLFTRTRAEVATGYEIITDLDGNELSRKRIVKSVSIYHFDRGCVEDMLNGMNRDGEFEDMMENANLMSNLANLIKGV